MRELRAALVTRIRECQAEGTVRDYVAAAIIEAVMGQRDPSDVLIGVALDPTRPHELEAVIQLHKALGLERDLRASGYLGASG